MCLHTQGEVRHFGTQKCAIHYWLIWYINYQNLLIFAKVITKCLVARFLMDHSVSFCWFKLVKTSLNLRHGRNRLKPNPVTFPSQKKTGNVKEPKWCIFQDLPGATIEHITVLQHCVQYLLTQMLDVATKSTIPLNVLKLNTH